MSIIDSAGKVAHQLAKEFPLHVFLGSTPEYKLIQASYWSGTQKDIKPRCHFQPHSAQELARAVSLCVEANCAFGVKSGGHGHYAGQSCMEDGVQFDLCNLNKVEIDKVRDVVTVGTGCTWGYVYEILQKEKCIAIGGRSADVGVGGFMLGGGISFYAAEHGWAIDRVRSFEVVLASGELVRASRDENHRLFRALRGGGSNFGIVTAFELELLPYNGMWGGRTTIDKVYARDALKAYTDFIPKLETDPKGHTIIIFDYFSQDVTVRQYMAYSQPVPDVPMFDGLRKIPTVDSSLGFTDYSNLAANIAELQGDEGYRNAVSTMTVRLDYDLLEFAYNTYVDEASIVDGHGGGCLEFHALPRSRNPAENMYGLDSDGPPLIAIMLAFGTVHKGYDYSLIALQYRILGKIRRAAEKRGLYHPFLFANYAGPFQDVASGFGEPNLDFLRKTARKYDPKGAFQRLQPGGFKLGCVKTTLEKLSDLSTIKPIGDSMVEKT